MTHQYLLLRLQPEEQLAVRVDGYGLDSVLGPLTAADGAAEVTGEHLHAVTDAKHRFAARQQAGIVGQCVSSVHADRTTTQYECVEPLELYSHVVDRVYLGNHLQFS